MKRILAVITPTEAAVELLEEAGTIAAAMDVELVVLALALEGSDHSSRDAMRDWKTFEDTGSDEADTAHQFAKHFGAQVLDQVNVDYLPVGDDVDDTRPSGKIIDVAENHGCDHIFVTNRSRSPAGKALFGDTTQSVILNFDGFVTVRSL